MDFFLEYGAFLLKTATIVIAIILVISSISLLKSRPKSDEEGELHVKKLNDELEDYKFSLEIELLTEAELKLMDKERKKEEKAKAKEEKAKAKEEAAKKKAEAKQAKSEPLKEAPVKEEPAQEAEQEAEHEDSTEEEAGEERKKRVYVLDFDGDVNASATYFLRHEITAILTMATPQDEVVVRLESPGGVVHGYGFAASQLQRIRDKGIELTICVDHVAASGGYMMAALANKIVAAPFAVVGSIGVVAQLPNFNKVLKKLDVDYELFTAGEYKRTVTMFGENTDKAKEKFQSDLEDTHVLFKQHVSRFRPNLDIEKVANGDIWYGQQALEQGLIDAIGTSDDYIADACNDADVYSIRYELKKTLKDKLGLAIQAGVERAVTRTLTVLQKQYLTK